MSVYISGVEMPKEHPLYITLRPDGSVHVWDSYSGGGYGAQAISVSKHGKLIDADALLRHKGVRDYKYDYEAGKVYVEIADICGAIDDAPAIIPAEDDDDFYTKGHLHLGRVEEGEG